MSFFDMDMKKDSESMNQNQGKGVYEIGAFTKADQKG